MTAATPAGDRGRRETLARLASAQKPPTGTPAYSRWVNRPAARHVAAFAHSRGMSPDAATATSATLSGAAILLLCVMPPEVWVGIVVAVLLAAGYVWDSVDGQLARLRGGGSARGEWLDHTVDCVKTTALHLAVLVSFLRYPADSAPVWIPVLYCLVATVLYFGLILTPKMRAEEGPRRGTEHPLRPWYSLPADYGALCWVFALLGLRDLFALVYGALAVVTTLMLLAAWRSWWISLTDR